MSILSLPRRILTGAAAVTLLIAPAMATSGNGSGQYDPFKRKPPPKPASAKPVLKEYEIPPPGLTKRLDECKAKSTAYGASSSTTPCPYLVSEMKITGVYSGDGLTALAVATPNNLPVYLQVGDKLYDGEVTEIVEANSDTEAYVIIKKSTRFRAKGGERTETKSVTLKLVP
jgi:hypothetical protein